MLKIGHEYFREFYDDNWIENINPAMLRIFDALIDGNLKVDANGEFKKSDLVKIDKEDDPKYFSNKGLKNLIDAYLLINFFINHNFLRFIFFVNRYNRILRNCHLKFLT